MSHYPLISDAWPEQVSLSVGWDPETETYFARVTADRGGGHAGLPELIPLPPRRIPTVDSLERELNRHIEGRLPGVTLPDRIRQQLLSDKVESENAAQEAAQAGQPSHPGGGNARKPPRTRPVIRPTPLPEDRKHWIPATQVRGCMAVNLDTKPYYKNLLVKACQGILARHADTAWPLPEDLEHSQPAGEYPTAEVMGRYANGTGRVQIYFDPRMAPHIREVIDIPPALPRNRRHWIPVTMKGCSLIGVERATRHTVAMRRLCARLLDEPGGRLWLPYDRNRGEPEGWHATADVIRIYTYVGKPPVYYFDPRLLAEGIITKQAVKAEAASLTPEDLATPDPRLLAARRRMLPSATKQRLTAKED